MAATRPVSARVLGGVLAALGVGVAAGVLGLGVLSVVAARRVITPPRKPTKDTRIRGVGEEWIDLEDSPEVSLRGRYGLWFDGDRGHAKIGEILDRRGTVVRRQLIGIDRGVPVPGMTARLGAAFYLSPRELGVPVVDVHVDTEYGPAPAWFVPASTGDAESADGLSEQWVILVHGRAANRWETIRAIPPLRRAGWNALAISYRNDAGAPASPDGRYALGDREWRDVEAAVAFARARGARRIVLMGFSMGGALSLQMITRSPLARCIESVMLDSPVVDWITTLGHQARVNRLPRVLLPAVVRLLSSRWGEFITGQFAPIDLQRLDIVRGAAALRTPILIMHSVDDGFVPVGAARALAAERSDLVHLVEFTAAHHVRLWNYDPVRWESTIEAWLASSDAAARRQRP